MTQKLRTNLNQLTQLLEAEHRSLLSQVDAIQQLLYVLRKQDVSAVAPRAIAERVTGAASTAKPAKKKVTRYWSPASRKAAAARMRKYWSDRKLAERRKNVEKTASKLATGRSSK